MGLSCRVMSWDMCSVTRWCNKTFLSEAQSPAHLAVIGFVCVCVRVCVCREVLGRSWEESCKCPPAQQGQRWEPLTSEGTDCQGQLVWPMFIYLFLNKRQVVTLEKGTQTQSHMRLCTDNEQTHTRMGRILFLSPHAYGYHPLNFGGAILLTFRKIQITQRLRIKCLIIKITGWWKVNLNMWPLLLTYKAKSTSEEALKFFNTTWSYSLNCVRHISTATSA